MNLTHGGWVIQRLTFEGSADNRGFLFQFKFAVYRAFSSPPPHLIFEFKVQRLMWYIKFILKCKWVLLALELVSIRYLYVFSLESNTFNFIYKTYALHFPHNVLFCVLEIYFALSESWLEKT